jgi:hypothetical protein
MVVLDVSKLDAPATIAAGSPLTAVLTVTVGGCTSFENIVANRSASGASLVAYGRNAAKGRKNVSCPADVRSESHSYAFDPPSRGEFTIQVQRGSGSRLTATVQVQ